MQEEKKVQLMLSGMKTKSEHMQGKSGRSTAPALALATNRSVILAAGCASSEWPQAGRLPHTQVAIGGQRGARGSGRRPEQEESVKRAGPAAGLQDAGH